MESEDRETGSSLLSEDAGSSEGGGGDGGMGEMTGLGVCDRVTRWLLLSDRTCSSEGGGGEGGTGEMVGLGARDLIGDSGYAVCNDQNAHYFGTHIKLNTTTYPFQWYWIKCLF